MSTPRLFSAYPASYTAMFLEAHKTPKEIILSSKQAARNMRYRLYAFRQAALNDLDALHELGASGARLALLLPLARISILPRSSIEEKYAPADAHVLRIDYPRRRTIDVAAAA